MTRSGRGARRPSPPRTLRGALAGAFGDQTGSVTVQNMIWMATLLAASGFAIDTANAFRIKAMLQAAADAAALAAVIDLPNEVEARQTARAFAELNLPPARHGEVMGVADVQVGSWVDGVFQAGVTPLDAVRVELGRTTGRGNPLPTLLLKLAGKTEFEIEADAVARRGSVGTTQEDPCAGGGFAAGGEATVGSGNLAPDGWCLHGEAVLEIGGDNVFETGAVMSVE
ncbi:MAG: pilus assembly protein TadG-related protein, partial [Pseudomonadota bacterium]